MLNVRYFILCLLWMCKCMRSVFHHGSSPAPLTSAPEPVRLGISLECLCTLCLIKTNVNLIMTSLRGLSRNITLHVHLLHSLLIFLCIRNILIFNLHSHIHTHPFRSHCFYAGASSVSRIFAHKSDEFNSSNYFWEYAAAAQKPTTTTSP